MSQRKRPGQPPSTPSVPPPPADPAVPAAAPGHTPAAVRPRELGGVPGPEPTRFGDWERNGRCIDF